MQAQRYRHRVAVQEQIETQDSTTGDIEVSWQTVQLESGVDLDAVPAEVLLGPGREFIKSDVKQADTTARINMAWFPGLIPSMRLLWEGRVFDILSIETDATYRREYRLRCRDGLTDGQ